MSSEPTAFQLGLEAAMTERGCSISDLARLPEVADQLEKQAFLPAALAFGLPAAATVGLANLGLHVAKPTVIDLPGNLGQSIGETVAGELDPSDPVADYKAQQLRSELQFQTGDTRRRLRARLRQMLAEQPNLDPKSFT